MPTEIVTFFIEEADLAELDRLAVHFSDGSRSRFLRETILVMAARERAELQRADEA